jgi:acetyl esterase
MPSETSTNPQALIDPQQAEALKRNGEIVAENGGPGEGIAEVRERAESVRKHWNAGGPEMATNEARTIPGPFRDVPVQLYKPSDADGLPVFVYLHGGGFKIGSPTTNDLQLRQLADVWGGAIVSADYVHVPEHTFPDPVDEAVAVVEWIAANGRNWGLDPDRMSLGGASAGASVAMGTALTLRDQGKGDLLKAIASLYGVLDYNLESDSMKELGGGDFMLTTAYTQMVYDDYLPNVADRDDPRAFAVKADPAGLPPVFVAAAQLDPIRDDSLAFGENLKAVGHPHELAVYPGVLHAFFGFSSMVDEARHMIDDLGRFLTKHTGAV